MRIGLSCTTRHPWRACEREPRGGAFERMLTAAAGVGASMRTARGEGNSFHSTSRSSISRSRARAEGGTPAPGAGLYYML
jgi:hypothetical protein